MTPDVDTPAPDCTDEPKLTAEEWAAVAALTAAQQPEAEQSPADSKGDA